MMVRPAAIADIDRMAEIWHQGWHDAHASLMPELIPMRSLQSFKDRLPGLLEDASVAEHDGILSGLCILKGDELYQLYVAAESRGAGIAQALIGDAEDRLMRNGTSLAWLACAIGNERAARFYEKSGWVRAGTTSYQTETANGPFRADVWRFEKRLPVT